jgi:hypothetical protein
MKLQDFNFSIKHMGRTSNGRTDALSQPESTLTEEKRLMTLFPERLFLRALVRDEEEFRDDTLSSEEKAELIKIQHNLPTTGHLGIRRTIEKLCGKGHRWKGLRSDVLRYSTSKAARCVSE